MVVLTFSKPGIPLTPENNHLPYEQLRGDSYLAITPPAYKHPSLDGADRIEIQAITPVGQITFEGLSNDRGFLAQFRCEMDGASFQDVLTRSLQALQPALSDIAAQLDIPLEIGQTDIVELRTTARHTLIVTTPAEMPFALPGQTKPSDEYRAYAGLYRDGTNSTSLRYRFLCYYKIADAIYTRRGRIAQEIRTKGGTPPSINEMMPKLRGDREAWLRAIFSPPFEIDDFILDETFPAGVLGRKIRHVFGTFLQPIRTRIAHAVLDSGEIVRSPDEPDEEREVTRWLPLMKCIARRLMKNAFPDEFLSYLNEDGSIKTS